MDIKSNNQSSENEGPKTRVLFVITQSEIGGAQIFLSQLLNNIDNNKFECAIVTGPEGNEELRNLLPPNLDYIISKHLRRNPGFFRDIASLFEIRKIIKKFRPDTIFLNSSKAGFNGSLAVKLLPNDLRHPKIIYRIGGWSFNDPRSRWKNIIYRLLEKISAPWKDYIIVNNKYDYEQASRYGIMPRKEIRLIHNGIDPYKIDFLDKDEAQIRLYELMPEKHGNFLHKGLTIGTIANFYPTKGLQYLIEAFEILSHLMPSYPEGSEKTQSAYRLVIIGDGPERKNLESKIKDLKLESKIFLTGRIANAQKYLKAFDVFVLPSVKEGFPWALLEAMSAKLAIITTNVGANPEIIENEKNGLLVRHSDPQAIAEALKKMIKDESLRRELGIQAHQTVLFKFDLKKMLQEIEKLLI